MQYYHMKRESLKAHVATHTTSVITQTTLHCSNLITKCINSSTKNILQ